MNFRFYGFQDDSLCYDVDELRCGDEIVHLGKPLEFLLLDPITGDRIVIVGDLREDKWVIGLRIVEIGDALPPWELKFGVNYWGPTLLITTPEGCTATRV